MGLSAIAASRGRPQRHRAPRATARERGRASRGGRQGVVDGPEPEDEPDPSAEVTAAPGKLPRLGEKDLEQLVEPFERLGCHLPKHIEKPEARITCDQHMETWWLMQRVLQDRRTAPAARLREPPADGELRVPPTPSCASCSSCLEERAGSAAGALSQAGACQHGTQQHTSFAGRRSSDGRLLL